MNYVSLTGDLGYETGPYERSHRVVPEGANERRQH